MSTNFEPSFIRYLAAKQTVDDRALNHAVWQALVRALPSQSPAHPLRVLEVGAGIGTMIERLIERGVLRCATYTAIDAGADNIAELERRSLKWGETLGLRAAAGEQRVCLEDETRRLTIEAQVIDVLDFSARAHGKRPWDVLIAHAFLDLLNLPRALPHLLALLRPGGLFYFTINFDGATILEPSLDPALDAEIERLYHQTMDERVTHGEPSGDSHTGRRLFHLLRQAGGEILEAGSSDWVVYADRAGYRNDEAYFLHFIVETLRGALSDHPQLANRRAEFEAWIDRRHRQIEEGELVYIAHQLDFVGRMPEAHQKCDTIGVT